MVYTVTSANGLSINYTIDIWPDAGLPVVYITTTNGVYISSKEETVDGFVLMYGGLDYPDLPKTEMVIRGRGNSTWGVHPKKPYQLKFTDKTEVLGMPDDRKWIFLAEYSDKTIIRNKITFEMGHISQLEWTPQSVYAEVYVNNNYNGVYLITQKVEESKNRLDIGDEGYLMELDTRDHIIATDVYFNTNDFLIKIKEPELEWNNPQYNLIKHISASLKTFYTVIFLPIL